MNTYSALRFFGCTVSPRKSTYPDRKVVLLLLKASCNLKDPMGKLLLAILLNERINKKPRLLHKL